MTRHPLPSPGSWRNQFPCFDGTMECSDSLTSFTPHFVSFARRLPSLAPVFVAPAKSDADLKAGGFWVWHLPTRPVHKEMETPGRPKFLGNPDVPAPCSKTPARPTLPQASTVGRHGPTHRVPRGLSTRGNFGARSHGIGTRCLRFAVRITPPHARLASGCGPRSTKRDWLPAGFQRKVSEMLLTSLPPSPS
jgi:hypothetical protein